MRLFVPAAFLRGERGCSPPPSSSPHTAARRGWAAWLLALVAALGMATPPTLPAQGAGGTITGRVTDAATGQPIQQARVLVSGTQNGTLTAENGRYSLRVTETGAVTLEVSRIGFEAKKVTVTVGSAPVVQDVALTQAAFSLAAVVTTVTGQQRKVELANATTQIAVAEKVAELPVSNMGQLLSGRAAGVQVTSGGATGSGSRIRIRGQASLSLSNDPVVIIDGVRMTSNTGSSSIGVGGSTPSRLDDLNPEEIENIEVIKGPSAATLYGTEAANGVINITTKRGRAGKTRWNVYTENGRITDPNTYPLMYYGWGTQLSGATAGTRVRCPAISIAASLCRADSLRVGNAFLIDSLSPVDQGARQQYGMQVSGGTDRVQYFVSGETEVETGIYKMPDIEINRLKTERGVSSIPSSQVRPNALDRNSLRANITAQLSPKATLQVSSGFINSRQRLPQNEDNGNGLMVGMLGGEWREDLRDGRGVPLLGWRAFPMGDILSRTTSQSINRFINSVQVQYNPISWLTTRAVVGSDFTARSDVGINLFDQGPLGVNRVGQVSANRAEINQQTVDLGGTANKQVFSWLNSKTSVGMQYIRNAFAQSEGTGQGLPPGATTTSAAGLRNASQSFDERRTLGYYVEQVFNVNEKLFITAGLRRDAASAFGRDFRAVNYPKVGASWVISDQGFFPAYSWLNTLRLRATYGATGQIPGATDALRFFSPFATTISGQTDQPGVTLGALGNPSLRPEYSDETEAGFDLTMFDGKSNFEFTYYDRNTTDALIERRVAPSIAGVTARFDNIGKTRNTGFEIVFNQKVITTDKIGLDFVLTGSTLRNELITLGEGVSPIPTGNRNTQLNTPGFPLFGLWGRPYTFNDANGDGILVASEMTYGANTFIGPTLPTRELAFTPTLELFGRKLRISGQMDSRWGMKKLNNTKRHHCQAGFSCQGLYAGAPLEEQAKAVAAAASVFTGFYEDGSFTRFRELSLSYQMPNAWAKALKAERWNVVLTGRNLGVWTPFTGVDPETTVGNGDQRGNEEFFSTPPMRYWTFRMNFNF